MVDETFTFEVALKRDEGLVLCALNLNINAWAKQTVVCWTLVLKLIYLLINQSVTAVDISKSV